MGQLVALGPAQEMPTDPGGRRAQFRQHLLRVVLTDIGQAGSNGGVHGLGAEPLGHSHHLHRTGPGPARSIRSRTPARRSATVAGVAGVTALNPVLPRPSSTPPSPGELRLSAPATTSGRSNSECRSRPSRALRAEMGGVRPHPTVGVAREARSPQGGIGIQLGQEIGGMFEFPERMYTIKIRGSDREIMEELAEFGRPAARFVNLRLVNVRQIHGVPNQTGSVIR